MTKNETEPGPESESEPASESERSVTSFLDALRRVSPRGPGRGLGRFARLVRGGAGLAAGVLRASRRGPGAAMGLREIRDLEKLVARLGELKALPMKMGQLMSYMELDLPEEARALLSLLQTQAPATPFAAVEATLREDLGGRAGALLERLDPVPVSIASIGQVHRGRLPDGTDVAVKVLHPGIEAAIRSDFRAASIGRYASAVLPGMGATVRDAIDEVKARILEECDYALEAERQRRFAALFADHPAIVVPEVHDDWSGPRILTTTWQAGRPFDRFCVEASQDERDRAGAALFDFYIGTLYRSAVFHADPHPGNYIFRDDGRVVVFDYGCVRVFEPEVTRAFIALAAAVRDDDRGRVTAALRDLGAVPSSDDATYAHLRRLLRSFFDPMLVPGRRRMESRSIVRLAQMTRDKMAIARLRLPGKLVFLFRIRFGLFAVLARLGAVCDWASMERTFAEKG